MPDTLTIPVDQFTTALFGPDTGPFVRGHDATVGEQYWGR